MLFPERAERVCIVARERKNVELRYMSPLALFVTCFDIFRNGNIVLNIKIH